MTIDVSGFGSVVSFIASKTYPKAFILTALADDVDPIDISQLQIADGKMGGNGDLVTWTTCNPVELAVAIIPNSLDDLSMSVLFQANRASKGKASAQDVITSTIIFPNLAVATYSRGRMTEGPPGLGFQTEGRLKTHVYKFIFESLVFVPGIPT